MSKADAIRVGIIGAGRVGVDWHARDIPRAGGRVVALADSVPGRAGRHAERLGLEHAFDDPQALIDHPDVDAVAVCTPPHVHLPLAEAVLATGKPLYLEKPPALTAEDMRRIAGAAERSESIMFVGSNLIYRPEIQYLRAALDAGRFGEVYHLEAFKLFRANAKRGWHRLKAVAGGGVGMDSTAHRIEQVLYLLPGLRSGSVTARTSDHFVHRPVPPPKEHDYQLMDVAEATYQEEPEADVEDALVAFVQFDAGPTLMLRDAAGAHMPDHQAFRLFGTEAGASMQPLTIHHTGPAGEIGDEQPDLPEPPQGTHTPAYEHFFDCIRRGEPTDSPPERAVRVMQLIGAIYASAADAGRPVRFGD
ncbi:MAG: Gfo/Idh/MocA family protein [Phycisphaeraceae bacterium]